MAVSYQSFASDVIRASRSQGQCELLTVRLRARRALRQTIKSANPTQRQGNTRGARNRKLKTNKKETRQTTELKKSATKIKINKKRPRFRRTVKPLQETGRKRMKTRIFSAMLSPAKTNKTGKKKKRKDTSEEGNGSGQSPKWRRQFRMYATYFVCSPRSRQRSG